MQLSKDLVALGGNETWQRCVISRAYYASLHATNETFPRNVGDVRPDHESSHAEIINRAVRYGKSFDPGRTDASQIAQALPRLRKLRNFADYDLDEALSAKEYEDGLRRAEKILNHCSEVVRLRAAARPAGDTANSDGPAVTVPATGTSDSLAPLPPLENQTPEESVPPPRPTLKRVK
ncbi:hypothetical protein [Variovorax paradoxus]|uniref:hypothetical protein n=1 Tax=Variovorax paradoxus TaxID=34073 RepID=UPI00248058A6|nr:hypothetical protein [Variovorax paradoxus]WGT64436.1 hypothetical protein QHG62_03610 [Variovorax paradoxus]